MRPNGGAFSYSVYPHKPLVGLPGSAWKRKCALFILKMTEICCMLKGYASYQLDETDRQVANSENPTEPVEPVLYDENPDDMESFEPPRGQIIPSSIMARKSWLEDEMCDYE